MNYAMMSCEDELEMIDDRYKFLSDMNALANDALKKIQADAYGLGFKRGIKTPTGDRELLKVLRAQCDDIMLAVGAGPNLTYSELAALVRKNLK